MEGNCRSRDDRRIALQTHPRLTSVPSHRPNIFTSMPEESKPDRPADPFISARNHSFGTQDVLGGRRRRKEEGV